MAKPVILVLFGGCSSEHQISLSSAYAVLGALARKGYATIPVGITRKGEWLYYTGAPEALPEDVWQLHTKHCIPCAPSLTRGANRLELSGGRTLSFNAVFPVLHGKNGEDGTIQGLFELAGVPIIGCGTLSSALCMDKDRAHKLAAQAGVKVPDSAILHRGEPFSLMQSFAEQAGYPLFVKPVRGGSSIGITRVMRQEELFAAIQQAFEQDDEILLEEEIAGFEVGCAVMGNETLTAGLVDEIELGGGFFGFDEKYSLKTSRIHCPARISAAKTAGIQAAAKLLYRALGCRVCARVDFFLKPDGELIFNEINTIPGFTNHSRYPTMMQGIGLDFDTLIEKLVALGVAS